MTKNPQHDWAQRPTRDRLRAVGRIAAQIAMHRTELLALSPRINATPAEIISSELLPLADACRYAANVGRRALAPTMHSMLRGAWWMGRIGVRVTREPWGVVLILAPSNYPLLLPGVQIIQALAAGNAVIVKPAGGCEAVMHRFAECAIAAGIPAELLQVLDSSIAAGQQAIEAGVDKVFLTGSANTGRTVLAQLSKSLTPATLELGGCDSVFVTESADLNRVARCLAYALQLNGGATCIAPRRVFVTPAQLEPLSSLLIEELRSVQPTRPVGFQFPLAVVKQLNATVQQALREGAQLAHGELPDLPSNNPSHLSIRPLVLRGVKPQMNIVRDDIFAPIVSLLTVPNMSSAIEADRDCPYHLGASVFGSRVTAERWGQQIRAGCVVINDVVVPSADPRVSFGGCADSGWGSTRGWEGLLEMTRPKSICTRWGNWLPHLNRANAENTAVMSALLTLRHSPNWRNKFASIKTLITRG
ncbi:MAG: aldehyde dehydrogenase family protein [Pirellulaceae bacterium]|nr:aldehyde dehydrogenase family protein [Pirellulaceae bacterium]